MNYNHFKELSRNKRGLVRRGGEREGGEREGGGMVGDFEAALLG